MRLKDVVHINRQTLQETTSPDFEFHYVDISSVDGLGNIIVPETNTSFTTAPSRARRLAPAGATVVSTVRTYLRAIGRVPPSATRLVFSTGFTVIEAKPEVDPGFLYYLCRSEPFVQHVVARSVGVSYPAVNPSDIGEFLVDLPPIAEQRRIAEFLDAETRLIDAVQVSRQRMIELLILKRARITDELVGGGQEARAFVPLKYLASSVSVGIVITPAAWYVETGGVPALRGLNVKPGRIDTSDLVQISQEGHLIHRKSRLQSGDLVVVRTGQAGAAAVVPPELDGINCIDLVIVRPSTELNPKFGEYLLNSSYAKRRVSEFSVGSIQAHFNVAAMKAMPVPSYPVAEQLRRVSAIEEAVQPIEQAMDQMRRQNLLLMERRQALITAAVTGQIDVTTARGLD